MTNKAGRTKKEAGSGMPDPASRFDLWMA